MFRAGFEVSEGACRRNFLFRHRPEFKHALTEKDRHGSHNNNNFETGSIGSNNNFLRKKKKIVLQKCLIA